MKVSLSIIGTTLTTLCLTMAQAFAAENNMKIISPSDKSITHMGRFEMTADGSARFSYPGVSFFLNVNAESLSLVANSNNGNGWIDVIIDNGAPIVLQLSKDPQPIELFRFPNKGTHNVRVTNRTETWQAISTIKQFQIGNGDLLAPPQLPKRKLMVLGDSVTCGEMIDRVAGEKSNTRWSNARESYGMLTAQALQAQVQLVCMGGHGLIRSWDGKTNELNLPDFYPLTIPDQGNTVSWDEKNYDPDVIVSAIGTNDFSPGIPDKELYVNTYVKFLLRVLADHKHAHIFLTEGAILNGEKKAALIDYIAEAVKRVNDKRVHIASSTNYPGDKTDAHPTKEQHAEMAKDLTPQIKKVMKW